jgi:hypothetical protein
MKLNKKIITVSIFILVVSIISVFATTISNTFIQTQNILSDSGTLNINQTPDFWFYGSGDDSVDTSNFNLVSINGDDGSGATSRIAMQFWSGNDSGADFRGLGIHVHNNGSTQNKEVSFYSSIQNNSFSSKAFQWKWGEESDGALELTDLSRIQFPEGWTGFYNNESLLYSGIDSESNIFELVLDYDNDQGSEQFIIYKNNNKTDELMIVDTNGLITSETGLKIEEIGNGIQFSNTAVQIVRSTNSMDFEVFADYIFERQSVEKMRISSSLITMEDDLDINGNDFITNGRLMTESTGRAFLVGLLSDTNTAIGLESDNTGIARGTTWGGPGNNWLTFRGYDGWTWYDTSGTPKEAARMDDDGEFQFLGTSGDGTGKVVCVKADGNLGTCGDQPNASGVCTCS